MELLGLEKELVSGSLERQFGRFNHLTLLSLSPPVKYLAEKGAHIVIIDMNQDLGQALARDLSRQYPQQHFTFVSANVTKEEDIKLAIEKAQEVTLSSNSLNSKPSRILMTSIKFF